MPAPNCYRAASIAVSSQLSAANTALAEFIQRERERERERATQSSAAHSLPALLRRVKRREIIESLALSMADLAARNMAFCDSALVFSCLRSGGDSELVSAAASAGRVVLESGAAALAKEQALGGTQLLDRRLHSGEVACILLALLGQLLTDFSNYLL